MITSWNYGINSLPQYKHGVIYLHEEPLWLALCGWGIDILGYGCRCLHWIKMPSFLKVTDDGEVLSWREYYGDLGQIYHMAVYNPLFQWYETHPKRIEFHAEVGYDKVKELFGKRDAKFFAEHERIAQTK
jgi:hypothetical protein